MSRESIPDFIGFRTRGYHARNLQLNFICGSATHIGTGLRLHVENQKRKGEGGGSRGRGRVPERTGKRSRSQNELGEGPGVVDLQSCWGFPEQSYQGRI